MNTADIATILNTQFPEISPSTITLLGDGCDSWAFEVNRKWVFRFPKRAEVDDQFLVESQIISALAAQSPIALPAFCFFGHPSDLFPFHFVGYPKLPGVPAIQLDPHDMPVEQHAPAIGRFLSWLHRFPVTEASRLGVPHQNIAELIEEVQADALNDFDLLNDVAPAAPLDRWKARLAAGPSPANSAPLEPVLAHRDLAAEHLLYDPATREITGIIDWTEITVTDRSVDLAGFFHWGGEPLVNAVLAHYDLPINDGVLQCVRFLAACRGVGDVAFGLETGRKDYINAGLRALGFCLGVA